MNVTLKKQFNDQIMLIKKNIKDKSAQHLFLSKCIDNYLKCENEFSKKLDMILKDLNNFTCLNTFESYFTAFKLFFLNKKACLDKSSNNLKEMFQPMEQLRLEWEIKENSIEKEILNSERTILACLNDYDNVKANFNTHNSNCVSRLIKYEQIKASSNSDNSNTSTANQSSSLDQQWKQIQHLIDEGTENEKEYQNAYLRCIEQIDDYKEKLKKNLKKYIELDKEIVDNFKNTLQFILRNDKERIMLELDKHEVNKRNESLIAYSEIIENTKDLNVIEIDVKKLEPYEPTILHEGQKYEDDFIYNIIKTLKSKLLFVAVDYDVEKEGIKHWLIKICKNILEGKEIFSNETSKQEQQEKLYKYLKKKDYQMHFLNYLNYKRSEGKFKLTKKSFIQLGEIMKHILESLIETKEIYEALGYCLILSQTYYFLNANKEKVYVIRFFEDMSLFQEKKFWNFFFELTVKMELEKISNLNTIAVKDKDKHKENLVFSKLLCLVHNMFEFRLEKEFIKEIAGMFCKQNNLTEDKEMQVMMLINESASEKKETFNVERDLIEPNEEKDSKVNEEQMKKDNKVKNTKQKEQNNKHEINQEEVKDNKQESFEVIEDINNINTPNTNSNHIDNQSEDTSSKSIEQPSSENNSS